MSDVKYLTIKELPPEERPRERLQNYGPTALSDSELLAIMLRVGTRKLSAMDLGRNLLSKYGSLKGIASTSIEELCEIDGIGPAKAVQIHAAIEIGKRFSKVHENVSPQIRCSEDVRNLLWQEMRMHEKEHFVIILLDTKKRVTKTETVSIGILDSSIVHPREVFKSAIKSSASSVIVVHNHPSGDPTPSRDDIETTKRLREAGELMGIDILDHVILCEKEYYSFKDQDKM